VNEYFITTSSFFKKIGLNQKKFGPLGNINPIVFHSLSFPLKDTSFTSFTVVGGFST
jgi:hypothetical protein